MGDIKDDTGWKDSGHGYAFRSYKVENVKPFSMDDLKDVWCMFMPDGKGNVINYGGHWIDGKMVEEWREIEPDPLIKQ